MIINNKLKKNIINYIDFLIPENTLIGMPRASSAINIETFLKEILIIKNFKVFSSDIVKFEKFDSKDIVYSNFLKNVESRKFENNIFKLLIRHYFSSEVVIDALSKKNELINQDYTTLISNSEMIEKLIKNKLTE